MVGCSIFILQTACDPFPPGPETQAVPVDSRISLKRIVGGLARPTGLFHAGDGSGRLFVIEQGGIIRVLKNGVLEKKPYLDIRRRVAAGGEKGLLGLAFHPEFRENQRLFVNYTASRAGLHTVISEFSVGSPPDRADPASERILMTIPQPFSNHNGGEIAFGPDGYLYIGTGDGGAGNDPGGKGQDLQSRLGKMLRIGVDPGKGRKAYTIPPDNPFVQSSNAAPEIWAYGLRNPWRFSFDSVTGDLLAGDVGQSAREEINLIQKGGNYGWNTMEGNLCTPGVNPRCDQRGLTPPLLDYSRRDGTVVIGGRVYRGRALPTLIGAYLYGDFGSGRIWMLRYDGHRVTEHRLLLETDRRISAFGEDEKHELYIVDYRGEILKIVPTK
jgi:glucose/arabinose dehydrogenase